MLFFLSQTGVIQLYDFYVSAEKLLSSCEYLADSKPFCPKFHLCDSPVVTRTHQTLPRHYHICSVPIRHRIAHKPPWRRISPNFKHPTPPHCPL